MFPRGLPFGFSRDLASERIRSLLHFCNIDKIAQEARGSRIAVVLHGVNESDIDLLVCL